MSISATPKRDTGFAPDLKCQAGKRDIPKGQRTCKGHCRSHHSEHILASIWTHPVSARTQPSHHNGGKHFLKRKSLWIGWYQLTISWKSLSTQTRKTQRKHSEKNRLGQIAKYYSRQWNLQSTFHKLKVNLTLLWPYKQKVMPQFSVIYYYSLIHFIVIF